MIGTVRVPWHVLALLSCATALVHPARADVLPSAGSRDPRIRVATYSSEEVYRLYGYVGYQIDLQFEPGETFVGLGAGDIEGVSFVAEGNHLFLKPKAAKVGTNLTVLTSKRHYQFDYTASARAPDPLLDEVIYAVRFLYPEAPAAKEATQARLADERLAKARAERPRNVDYWFCGDPAVKPVAASDDGVHTRIRFGARSEQPAIFVKNDDSTESLLNFSMEDGDVVIHRLARQFIVRRGKLAGCIVNKAFNGGGKRLDSNTISPGVSRELRQVIP
ncbi:MAG TPA: TrbG/VirB9 family P-type conjugative transfer protein [Polyangiaceae bacterium]|nr:TrbG/VirB9 family P-type conjugative transfer protein [Polyangiaceae bacterium]